MVLNMRLLSSFGVSVVFLLACTTNPSDTGDAALGTPACVEAADLAADECATVNCLEAESLTCSYGEVTIDSDDCSCHARLALYDALCESEVPDSVETIDAGTTCESE